MAKLVCHSDQKRHLGLNDNEDHLLSCSPLEIFFFSGTLLDNGHASGSDIVWSFTYSGVYIDHVE